jgi:hypothetical protein
MSATSLETLPAAGLATAVSRGPELRISPRAAAERPTAPSSRMTLRLSGWIHSARRGPGRVVAEDGDRLKGHRAGRSVAVDRPLSA